MFYMTFFKLKKDIESIIDLGVTHRYLSSLKGISTLHVQVLQRVFAKFGDSYTLLDVYNISKKLELAHAHNEVKTMRLPSCSRPQPPLVVPTKSSHSCSRAKTIHSIAPILLSYNCCGNLTHKANECNIPSEDLFCDYCGKKGHHEIVCFANFSKHKQL
jgi:hypothetical protein